MTNSDTTTERATEEVQWTLEGLLDLFEPAADGPNRFLAQTGLVGADDRQVVEGTQVLAQAIVAAAARFPDKSVRSVHAVFARVVLVGPPVELDIDVVAEGRSTATAVISASQHGKRCITSPCCWTCRPATSSGTTCPNRTWRPRPTPTSGICR